MADVHLEQSMRVDHPPHAAKDRQQQVLHDVTARRDARIVEIEHGGRPLGLDLDRDAQGIEDERTEPRSQAKAVLEPWARHEEIDQRAPMVGTLGRVKTDEPIAADALRLGEELRHLGGLHAGVETAQFVAIEPDGRAQPVRLDAEPPERVERVEHVDPSDRRRGRLHHRGAL